MQNVCRVLHCVHHILMECARDFFYVLYILCLFFVCFVFWGAVKKFVQASTILGLFNALTTGSGPCYELLLLLICYFVKC